MEEQVAQRETASATDRKFPDAARERRRQALELQRERILSERPRSPFRRAALEAALEEVEAQLRQLQ